LTGTPTVGDQMLGTGDGTTSSFPLLKRYGEAALGTSEMQARASPAPRHRAGERERRRGDLGWTLASGGVINFTTPPASGAVVRAGFLFDVPVRFAQDTLEITGVAYQAGEAPNVPVVEIREAS
jgi:uncharacterized protein (TIGR02217 family)